VSVCPQAALPERTALPCSCGREAEGVLLYLGMSRLQNSIPPWYMVEVGRCAACRARDARGVMSRQRRRPCWRGDGPRMSR